MGALQRSLRHGYTSIDVSRRKWASLSAAGKEALSSCINSQTRLHHAQSPHWPAAIGTPAVRRGVAMRALRERRDAHAAVGPLMRELEDVVADVRRTATELASRLEAATRVLGAERANEEPIIHTESAGRLRELR